MPDETLRANPKSRRSDAILVALAALFFATSVAAESWPPLPPPRPSAPEPQAIGQTPTPLPAQDASSSNECLSSLKSAGFDVEAAETPASANGDCRIAEPVKLRSIPVTGRERPIRLTAEPILACRFAETFGDWLSSLAAPVIVGAMNSDLAEVHTGPGFECRNRNRLPSGKLSAHAEGLAIDISDFELADKSRVSVKPDGNEQHLRTVNAVRRAACGWFTTVLGPGADASHADHLHVDLQIHGSSDRYRICQ